MLYIAVIGGGECGAATSDLAEEVGRLIARRNLILVCGGGGGVMAAASRGARQAGGMVLGILPGNSNRDGNPYLTMAVATGMGEARNALIARTADGVIAIGGEYGTLSERSIYFEVYSGVRGRYGRLSCR